MPAELGGRRLLSGPIGLQGPHVLPALEGGGIRAVDLAHALPHLADGFIFVRFHPFAHIALHGPEVADPVY